MNTVYTFVRSENQRINSTQYIREHLGSSKAVDLHSTFMEQSFLFKIFKMLKYLLQILVMKRTIILGDLRCLPKYILILVRASPKIVLVDDGIATFWFYRDRYEKKWTNKLIFYSKYSLILESLYGSSNILFNQNIFRNSNKTGRNVIIIGGPYVENGWLEPKHYIRFINKIQSIYHDCPIKYVPHPLESEKKLNDLKIEIVSKGGDFIKKLSKHTLSRTVFISFFSSGLIDAYLAHPNHKFLFVKLPNFETREDEHLFGFNVEKSIYELFETLKFEELVL